MTRNAKETLSKAKELQQSDFCSSALKEEANKRAYENLEKQKKRDIKVSSCHSEGDHFDIVSAIVTFKFVSL